MTIDELVSGLDAVRRSGCGYMARCPAHDDRSPSLSIREGERGLLVRCFAGCSWTDICEAIGVKPKDLFYDTDGPVDRAAIRRTQARRQAARTRQRAKGRRADALREAGAVLRAATGIEISEWSGEQLDEAMNAVCDARELLQWEAADGTQYEPVPA